MKKIMLARMETSIRKTREFAQIIHNEKNEY